MGSSKEETCMFNAESLPPPPNNRGGGGGTRTLTVKDMVLGKEASQKKGQREFHEEELVDGDRLLPSFDIDDEAYEKIRQPWTSCLVVKLLEKHISYTALCEKLRLIWRPVKGFEVTDIRWSWDITVRHIPRERNMVTDELAKYATWVDCRR